MNLVSNNGRKIENGHNHNDKRIVFREINKKYDLKHTPPPPRATWRLVELHLPLSGVDEIELKKERNKGKKMKIMESVRFKNNNNKKKTTNKHIHNILVIYWKYIYILLKIM